MIDLFDAIHERAPAQLSPLLQPRDRSGPVRHWCTVIDRGFSVILPRFYSAVAQDNNRFAELTRRWGLASQWMRRLVFRFLIEAFGHAAEPEIWGRFREFYAYFGAARVTAADAGHAATSFRPILWILDNKHLPYCHRGC